MDEGMVSSCVQHRTRHSANKRQGLGAYDLIVVVLGNTYGPGTLSVDVVL
jgi:hypothetical protein